MLREYSSASSEKISTNSGNILVSESGAGPRTLRRAYVVGGVGMGLAGISAGRGSAGGMPPFGGTGTGGAASGVPSASAGGSDSFSTPTRQTACQGR